MKRRRRGRARTGAGTALPAALVLAGLSNGCRFGLPEPATREAADVARLWSGATIAALVVGGVVLALILWALLRYRAFDDSLPDQTEYHVPLEVAYTVLPVLVVAVLFGFTYATQRRVLHTDPAAVVVRVDAFQWGWSFSYEGTDVVVRSGLLDAPELVLPTGEPVSFRLGSRDVIHAFYVPRFLFKRDAIPGRVGEFTLTVDRVGRYAGHCAEFCGVAHANMNFGVRAVAPDEFETWLAERSGR